MPIINRESFFDCPSRIAICGIHFEGDAIHVGIAIKEDVEVKIIHFLNGSSIPYESASQNQFEDYFFNVIEGFPEAIIDSMAALCELVTDIDGNQNEFFFVRNGVIYDGVKFDISTGNYQVTQHIHYLVNCGVFVMAFLHTFNYILLDWNTWPIQNFPYTPYLQAWLQNVPMEQHESYYNTSRGIRGKHIIVCPDTDTKPSIYQEVLPLSETLIQDLNA